MPGIEECFQVSIQGEGRETVVLANGFGTTKSAWAQVITRLSTRCRVVTFEYAGAAPATISAYQPLRHRRLHGFAEDLVNVVESLDLAGATFVGHSVSSMIGMLAVNAEPSLFSRVMFISGSAHYIDDTASGYVGGFSSASVTSMLAEMRADYAAWANGFSRFAMQNEGRPELAEGFADTLKALRPDMASAILETILHADCRDDARQYARLGLPTRLLQPTNDPAVPMAAAEWLRDATGGSLHRLEVEGHCPQIVAPETIARAILEFVDE